MSLRERLTARELVEVPGEGVLRPLRFQAVLEGRATEPAPRVVAGEAVAPRSVGTRRAQRIVDVGQPAPLLIRLMRHKTTLEPGARSRVAGRARLEERPDVDSPWALRHAACAEREPVDRDMKPRPPLAPRGLAVSRLGEEG